MKHLTASFLDCNTRNENSQPTLIVLRSFQTRYETELHLSLDTRCFHFSGPHKSHICFCYKLQTGRTYYAGFLLIFAPVAAHTQMVSRHDSFSITLQVIFFHQHHLVLKAEKPHILLINI